MHGIRQNPRHQFSFFCPFVAEKVALHNFHSEFDSMFSFFYALKLFFLPPYFQFLPHSDDETSTKNNLST